MKTRTRIKIGTGMIIAGLAGMGSSAGGMIGATYSNNKANTPEVSNVLQLEEEVKRLSDSTLPEFTSYPGARARYAAEVRQEYGTLMANPDVKEDVDEYLASREAALYFACGLVSFMVLYGAGYIIGGSATSDSSEKKKQAK